jgi:hypothetical protein
MESIPVMQFLLDHFPRPTNGHPNGVVQSGCYWICGLTDSACASYGGSAKDEHKRRYQHKKSFSKGSDKMLVSRVLSHYPPETVHFRNVVSHPELATGPILMHLVETLVIIMFDSLDEDSFPEHLFAGAIPLIHELNVELKLAQFPGVTRLNRVLPFTAPARERVWAIGARPELCQKCGQPN